MGNNVILITGGSSGFGRETARMFAEKGETVIITGRNTEKLAAAAKEFGAEYIRADVTVPADWDKVFDYVIGKYGRIDLLMNNAGGGVAIREIKDQTIEDIDRVIATNLNGTVYGCRKFAPQFIKQKGGTIINVSSICAKYAWPGWGVYAAAKWGVLGLTKGLYTELCPYNVRVTCLMPGAGDTDFDKNANFTGRGCVPEMKASDIAQMVLSVFYLPKNIWVGEVDVWGTDQRVIPF